MLNFIPIGAMCHPSEAKYLKINHSYLHIGVRPVGRPTADNMHTTNKCSWTKTVRWGYQVSSGIQVGLQSLKPVNQTRMYVERQWMHVGCAVWTILMQKRTQTKTSVVWMTSY